MWSSLAIGLLAGIIAGSSTKFFFAYPTADWAANGVPLLDRLLQTWKWWLLGFVPGACLGFFVGPLIYWLSPTNEWIEADASGLRAKRVEAVSKVIAGLIGTGMLTFALWVIIRAA